MERTSLVIVVEYIPILRRDLKAKWYTVEQHSREFVLAHCHRKWEKLRRWRRPGYVAVLEVPTRELDVAVTEALPQVREIVGKQDIFWFCVPARVRRFDAVHVCYANGRHGRGWKRLSRALLPQ